MTYGKLVVLPGGVLSGCWGVAGVLRRGAGVRAQTARGTLASLDEKRDAGKAKQAAAAQEKARTRQQIYLVSPSTVQVRS